jgi:uncharacterized protein YkwD
VLTATAAGSGRGAGLPALGEAIVADVNAARAAHGLAPLAVSRELAAAAAEHDLEMASGGYFDHDSADGSPFTARLDGFCAAGGPGCAVGENLLWASPTLSADRALALWMASPEHRANILSPKWRRIGVAALQVPNAVGVFGNGPAAIVTADFGAT